MSDTPPLRRFHALNTLYEAISTRVSPNSCDLVVLDGALDVGLLRQAIRQALLRHPVLGSRIVRRRSGSGWVEMGDCLDLDVRFEQLATDDAPVVDAHLLAKIWSEPLMDAGRPVRFHVTRTPLRTYLQTIHTHLYADASACYLLTEQISEAYSRLRLGCPVSVTRVDLRDRSLGTLLGRAQGGFTRARAGDTAKQMARDLASRDGGLALPNRDQAGARRLHRVAFSAEQTGALLRAARGRGCSVHGLFQLAFMRTAGDFNRRRGEHNPRLRLWDFFSLRGANPELRPLYDCLALIYPVELDLRWSDDEALRRFKQNIENMRSGDLSTHAYRLDLMLKVLGKVVPTSWTASAWSKVFKSNVFFTNPGVCPSRLERFGDVKVLDYVTFPQLFPPAQLMFVFSTFRDRLRVLCLHDELAFGDRFEADLLQPFLERLAQLGGVDLPDARRSGGFVAHWSGSGDVDARARCAASGHRGPGLARAPAPRDLGEAGGNDLP